MEIEERVVRKRTIRDFLRQVPRRISETVEHFFYKLGLRIARRPVKWLIGSAVIVLVSLSGLYFFHQEKNPVKLWVPQDSDFVHDTEWMIQQFGQGLRTESMILTADDVLEPEVLVKLNNITQQVLYAQTSDHIAWTDVCFKVPVISGIVDRKKRSKQLDDFFEPDIQINSTKFEPAVHADSKLYCNIVDNLPRDCLLNSIMDIWKYDSDTVLRKSKEEIINDLNNAKASPSLGHPLNFTELLGGVTTDKEGRIISARAVKTHWAVHINFTNVDMDGATFGNDAGTADWILPSLQSFCIYAAFGVLLTFLFQITFYVAFFTLDARRVESKRNSIVPCIIHENFTPKFVSPQEELSSKIITKLYSNVILTKPGKIMTILITIIAASAGVKGLLQLQQWFDPGWFIPDHSYLSKYIGMLRLEYPDRGYDAMILMGDFNYTAEFPKIISLAETFSDLSTVESIRSWPNDFAKFVMEFFGKDLRKTILEESQFQSYLSKFLFSQNGGKYQRNFRFKGELICGENTPPVSVSTMDFVFKRFHGPHQWIPAMDNSKQVARGVGIDGFVTVWSEVFSLWVTDKLIAQEVQRNVLLALICVMGMTGLLIAELQTCFWIFLCVLLTLLNVCGFMYFWGLTIDIASCIGLELGIGLCVDYAAHVAHAFVHAASVTGGQDRTERAHVAVRYIGAAVAYGAGSTLLALSMMVFSDSYVFHAFLKIFVLVILFGLWHGLFLLPVILSTIGPRSLKSHSAPQSPEKTEDAGDTVLSPLNKETES
ncbi:patched-related protein 9 isoform X2 [Osmia lignaria lignaria]|uniref:patched-related protein 9 isoform X2 n=1 Tax=Osmia lignaria lignaria TaxID=1437193 RepID=UPI00402BA2F4